MKQALITLTVLLQFFNVALGIDQVNGISWEANGMRDRDIITRYKIPFIKEFIETKDIWDFSKAEKLEEEETLINQTRDSLYIKTASFENRLYKYTKNKLDLIRHYKSGLDILYIIPETETYPLLCGHAQAGAFWGEGNVGYGEYIKNAGFSSSNAQTVGTLITPDCDTLKNVLQVLRHRSGTTQISNSFDESFYSTKDSLLLSNDSISHWLKNDSITHSIEKWQWYARGYRYPIIEMCKYRIFVHGTPSDSIVAAYYFPTYRQEKEIQNDSINEYYRENNVIGYEMPVRINNSKSSLIKGSSAKSKYPIQNKVSQGLDIAVADGDIVIKITSSEKTRNGKCCLYSSAGQLLWIKSIDCFNGSMQFKCPTTNLVSGVYSIVCFIGNEIYSERLLLNQD